MHRKMTCPLCASLDSDFYHQDNRRDYWQCLHCRLVYVDPAHRLTPEAEKAIYDLHENLPDDPGYLRFLSRLAQPLMDVLHAGAKGLDYGCGPSPVLAELLTQNGYPTKGYDPFYFPTQPQSRYDFISCTEAIEHFYQPGKVIGDWMTLLRPGGLLAIMTKRVLSKERFANWHYKNDQTHVCFFSEETFQWLADYYSLRLQIVAADVVFLHSDKV